MKLNNVFICLTCLVVGALAGVFFCNYTFFQFESKINLFDLISLLITSTLGLYVAIVVGGAFNRKSGEKGLLIEEIKKSITQIDKITELIEGRTYPLLQMNSEVKKLNEHLYLIDNLINASHCSKMPKHTIRQILTKLRNGVARAPISNNIVQLSIVEYTALKGLAIKLKQMYFELIFSVNKV